MPVISDKIVTHEEHLNQLERLKGKGFEPHESLYDKPLKKVKPLKILKPKK
jgi:hypothetical protein